MIQPVKVDCDPLWDGAGCGPLNTCCTFNNPPWFYKELPEPTTDDIEMRVCQDHGSIDEEIAIDIIICAIVGYNNIIPTTHNRCACLPSCVLFHVQTRHIFSRTDTYQIMFCTSKNVAIGFD